jgi:hypothetical protein
MNLPVIFLYPMLVLIACKTTVPQVSDKQEEYLRVQKTSYRIVNNEAIVQVSFSDNIWYQDSVGITQMSAIQLIQTDSKDTLFPITQGYRFVDMRRKWAYEYRNLSDTAAIVKKYARADSVRSGGGWGFFRTAAIQFDSLRLMGDTSVNGIVYQRYRHVQYFLGKKLLGEIFSRCDRKGTIFHLDTGLSNAAGCPVVKGVSLTPDGRLPTQSVEIEFISNIFPDSVRRVLAAWKRNVGLYPVE